MAIAISPRLALGSLLMGTVLAMSVGGSAHAQMGNQPYQPGAGAGVGLSSAARQAIYNSRVLGSQPRNLQRGSDGSLLDVARDGNQAFARVAGTGTLAQGARAGAGWATGLGTGLGWGNVGGGGFAAGYGRSGAASEIIMQWISMLNFVGSGVRVRALPPVANGGTPLDAWIGLSDGE
jgi:hypothetical protein